MRRTRGGAPRHDKRIVEPHADPYREARKPHDPTGCPECGASFRDGRWTWRIPPMDAPRAVCPACRRIADDYPAGFLRLEGSFVLEHADEILGLVHNVETREKNDHPLHRVMAVERDEEGFLITTTEPHLAHALGKALRSAYEGELEATYADGEALLRATWRRNAPAEV